MSSLEDVLSQLRELENFMRRHAVKHWADKFRDVQQGSPTPQELKARVLNFYVGTMGSLTDLIISKVNHHEVDDEKAANTELDRMVQELYERAKAL